MSNQMPQSDEHKSSMQLIHLFLKSYFSLSYSSLCLVMGLWNAALGIAYSKYVCTI